MRPSATDPSSTVVLLIDFDNAYPRGDTTREVLGIEVNRWISLALRTAPELETIAIRLYGGWQQDGQLSRAASELLTTLPRDLFPLSIRRGGVDRIIRGTLDLVDRLAAVPAIHWAHTFRSHRGLPQLRLAESPRPDGCAASDSCPIDLVQRMSRRRTRKCHVTGCSVSNETAFLLREQKMVDVMLACDAIEFATRGHHIIVISNDLDILPGVATTAMLPSSSVTLVRGPTAGDEDLYNEALKKIGVSFEELQAA